MLNGCEWLLTKSLAIFAFIKPSYSILEKRETKKETYLKKI